MLDRMAPVGCGIISPHKNTPRRPWVLDETLPKSRDPQEVMNERMMKRELEKAKNKPDDERNFMDYFILGKAKLDDMVKNSVIYMA